MTVAQKEIGEPSRLKVGIRRNGGLELLDGGAKIGLAVRLDAILEVLRRVEAAP